MPPELTPTETATVTDQTPPAAVPAVVPPVDPDEAEYLAAKAEAEKLVNAYNEEHKAEQGTPGQTPTTTDAPPAGDKPADAATPAATPAPTDGTQLPAAKPGKRTPMVPLPRVNEIIKDRNELAQENAYLKGQLEVLKTAKPADQATGTAPAQQQQTPEQQIAAIRQKQFDLAAKFDAGEIGMVEAKKQDATLDDQIFELRSAALKAAAPRQAEATPTPNSDLYLEQKTAELETAHPYSLVIPADHPRWEFIRAEAVELLAAKGIELPEGNLPPQERYVLREAMAQLTDHYGPLWYPNAKVTLPSKGQDPAGKPQTQQPGQLSSAQQQRFDKLATAATAPPNVNAMGAAADAGGMTAEQFFRLSEDDAAALPQSVRDKFRA